MKGAALLKKHFLRKKLSEHFKGKPNASQVVISAKFGGINTFWKVVKENKNFRVVEVNTSRDVFLLERDKEEERVEDPKIEVGDEPKEETPPKEAPADAAGLETGDTPEEGGETDSSGSKPEDSVGSSLQGHTVSNASLSLEPGLARLTLELASLKNPAVLEFRKDGSVSFSFRGRTQIFNKSSS
jgi:hypothetical protein